MATPYIEGTRVNEVYEITRDFTPNAGLPVMAKGSLSVENIFNSAMSILDIKLKEIDSRLKALEGKT